MTDPSFGVLLFTHRFPGMDDRDVLRLATTLAEHAERLGFDELWSTEHHFISYGVNPSALTLAAHLLGRTRRMRVGTAVTILPTHSPVAVAEQARCSTTCPADASTSASGAAAPSSTTR